MQGCPVDIEKLYNDHIALKNEENYKSRYKGKEKWYHGSGSGSCSRKLYYESIEQATITNPTDDRSNRVLRLGTIVHEDFELCIRKLQGIQTLKEMKDSDTTIYSNTTDSKTIDTIDSEKENKEKEWKFYVEEEILIPEYNVRGFYDLVAVSNIDGKVFLIDFKTMASFSWSKKFGWKNSDKNPSMHQELQLATYGIAIKKTFGRLDGMFLYYYNKDNSKMTSVEVSLDTLKQAENFWINVNEEHKKGLPMFREGISPVQDWNCRYCRYLDHCNPPFFKKK